MVNKVCCTCKEEKLIEQFSNNKNTNDGKERRCKDCVRKYVTENKERIKVYRKQYHLDNREHIIAKAKKWRKDNPHKVQEYTSRRYGYLKDRKPAWADDEEIKRIYQLARQWQERLGIELHVDHQIPIISDTVCGLHCEANLEILTAQENLTKGNTYYDN